MNGSGWPPTSPAQNIVCGGTSTPPPAQNIVRGTSTSPPAPNPPVAPRHQVPSPPYAAYPPVAPLCQVPSPPAKPPPPEAFGSAAASTTSHHNHGNRSTSHAAAAAAPLRAETKRNSFMTVIKNVVTQEMQNVLHLGGMEATKTKENSPKTSDMLVARVNPKLSHHMKGVRDESVIMDSKVSSQMIKGTKSRSARIAKMRGQA
jgi:hypothetical protein